MLDMQWARDRMNSASSNRSSKNPKVTPKRVQNSKSQRRAWLLASITLAMATAVTILKTIGEADLKLSSKF